MKKENPIAQTASKADKPKAKKSTAGKAALNTKSVMTYLHHHPKFFAQDTNSMRMLVKSLSLIHPTSKQEVSLMMYQNELWRQEASELKQHHDRLQELIVHERKLQQLVFNAYQVMEKVKDLPHFCQTLDSLLGKEFRVQAKRLFLFTKAPLLPYYQVRSQARLPAKIEQLLDGAQPIASHNKEIGKYFFDEEATQLGSYLLLPLCTKRQKPFAMLCLGDKNKHRFEPDMTNTLMSFFAVMVARELHKHLLAYRKKQAASSNQTATK